MDSILVYRSVPLFRHLSLNKVVELLGRFVTPTLIVSTFSTFVELLGRVIAPTLIGSTFLVVGQMTRRINDLCQ